MIEQRPDRKRKERIVICMGFDSLISNIGHFLTVMFTAMVPVVELKGAIPIGLGLGLNVWETYAAALIGSCIPAPFLMFFIRALLRWMEGCRFSALRSFCDFLNRKIEKGQQNRFFAGSVMLGLFLFVAIPLPSTGVWTGSMIAGVLRLDKRKAIPIVFLGNAVAGLIVLMMSHLIIA